MRGPHDIGVDLSRLRKTSPRAYAIRFALGGIITVASGLLGEWFGAAIGGLFLAFPAILPAGLTLIAKDKGEKAAGVDALGARIGSVALAIFGLAVWRLSEPWPGWLALVTAMIAWLAVSGLLWLGWWTWHMRKLKQRHKAAE